MNFLRLSAFIACALSAAAADFATYIGDSYAYTVTREMASPSIPPAISMSRVRPRRPISRCSTRCNP